MNANHERRQDESQARWENARARGSSELLAVLAPTDDEPQAIQKMTVWKTGPTAAPAVGSAS